MNNIFSFSSSFFAGFPVISTASAQGNGTCPFSGRGDWGMMGGFGSGMGWIGVLGGVVNLIAWVAIIIGIVYLIKYMVQQKREGGTRAMEILKERYAKGEITKEQFEQMMNDLR